MKKKDKQIYLVIGIALALLFVINNGYLGNLFSIVPGENYIFAIGDAYVTPSNPDNNYGKENSLYAGFSQFNSKREATYIQFDLSDIPKNLSLEKGELCLYYTLDWNKPHQIYKLNNYFIETNITWNNQPCGIDFLNSACQYTGINLFTDGNALLHCTDITSIINTQEDKLVLALKYLNNQSSSARSGFISREYGTGMQGPKLRLDFIENNYTESETGENVTTQNDTGTTNSETNETSNTNTTNTTSSSTETNQASQEDTTGQEALTDLESFWEQYKVWIVIGGIVIVVLLLLTRR